MFYILFQFSGDFSSLPPPDPLLYSYDAIYDPKRPFKSDVIVSI